MLKPLKPVYSQYHPLRKRAIKKLCHGFSHTKIRNHENPQDLDDFELRNPENLRNSPLLAEFELRKYGMTKKSCFLNRRY